MSYHLQTRKTLNVDGKEYTYYSLKEASKHLGDISRLPYSLKILLENMLRLQDDVAVKAKDIEALADWVKTRTSEHEVAFTPTRVLMQDFTGVPAVVDLAAMRDAISNMGGDPNVINPLAPVDLIIDHSVIVDHFGTQDSYKFNVHREVERNYERYAFLKWGQKALNNFRVVPPGTGICHQVNLEYLGQVVWSSNRDGRLEAYPDTLVGMDSHTTMINGLGILGWGVGGIEAEAAMLGEPFSMVIPDVIGFRLDGQLKEGTTATDLVLTVTQMLRSKGVVNKFVEFYGPGLSYLTIADRATIGNMSPEYGATCGIFPIDGETLSYLKFTNRDPHRIKLVEAYAKAQGLWHGREPVFTDTLILNLEDVEPSLAGPKRPQDKILLKNSVDSAKLTLEQEEKGDGRLTRVPVEGETYSLGHGDVVIAAITSCTNTSNPTVMVGAGLLARKALQKGLKSKPWVKTSLAPGSQVVTDYYEKAGLQKDLDALGFDLVGYGCTTCIGNSGPLPDPIAKTIDFHDLAMAAVLSGNRNFEGRIHSQVKMNYLASPPLVVAYALAGSMLVDLFNDPLGQDPEGRDVYLRDIWPTNKEIQEVIQKSLTPSMFTKRYANVFEGEEAWKNMKIEGGITYAWPKSSTYVKHPPYFDNMPETPSPLKNIKGMRPLVIVGDSITTDHISPAGSIQKDSPAGLYLLEHNVEVTDFNSYGSRRGNHEVMMRGTFANTRLQNEMTPGIRGGITRHMPGDEVLSIYDAAMRYQEEGVPLVIIAGKEYGTGSSRDWAAKGPRLLGVKAVIAESFERIHRSNLIGMGILPLVFSEGVTHLTLNLDGSELFDIEGLENKDLRPKMRMSARIRRSSGKEETIPLLCRIDTENEVEYYKHGGILHYVIRQLMKGA
ncbi:MAG: aconitate hydratase 1 [Alphaproteobacteria bacterium 41-28]|nr:MAG: aconitate hydratase 1 [Alphaproteobacteria bacterium 41-28]